MYLVLHLYTILVSDFAAEQGCKYNIKARALFTLY